ncbi:MULTISPECIES: transposase [Streptomyces]|uniref:transposase n=1 Tax=Streptomyces TaxID=1883 RepID=UPI0038645EAF
MNAPDAACPSKNSRASATGYGSASLGAPPTPLRQWGRVSLRSWAFAQLADFIVYKAKRAGVPLVFVDPAYTSQTCAQCGHLDKRNRVDQGLFISPGCGVVAHANRTASHNIAAR